jgi:hypothetical protein
MNEVGVQPSQTVELSPGQVAYRRQELKDLSRLNRAMFRWVYSGDPTAMSFFAAMFDKTDPSKDGCEATRSWDMTIQGDFYLLQRVSDILYIVVGDAAGHHAYAGALKVFVAAALQQVFERSPWFWSAPPSAAVVLQDLESRFLAVGKTALEDDFGEPLSGGANMVVVRIDMRGGGTSYASAGLPVFALGPAPLLKKFGDYSDGRGISFPKNLQHFTKFDPESGPLPTEGVDFLAFVTDGFRVLRRFPIANGDATEAGIDEFFGDDGVKTALLNMMLGPPEAELRPSADQVAERLVDSARQFRKGFMIPEAHDDDRLVVVVDIQKAQRAAADEPRFWSLRRIPNPFSSSSPSPDP